MALPAADGPGAAFRDCHAALAFAGAGDAEATQRLVDRLTAQGEKGDDLSREMTLPIALGAAAFVAGASAAATPSGRFSRTPCWKPTSARGATTTPRICWTSACPVVLRCAIPTGTGDWKRRPCRATPMPRVNLWRGQEQPGRLPRMRARRSCSGWLPLPTSATIVRNHAGAGFKPAPTYIAVQGAE